MEVATRLFLNRLWNSLLQCNHHSKRILDGISESVEGVVLDEHSVIVEGAENVVEHEDEPDGLEGPRGSERLHHARGSEQSRHK